MHFFEQDSVKLSESATQSIQAEGHNSIQKGDILLVDRALPGKHVRDHVDFHLGLGDLHLRGHLGLATEKE